MVKSTSAPAHKPVKTKTSEQTSKTKTAPKKKRKGKTAVNAPSLIAALEAHILGEREMTSTQVTAALALLKKFLAEDGLNAASQAMSHEDALELL